MSKKLLSGPYLLWMIGFTVIPLALIVFYGLTDRSGAFTLANVLSIGTAEHRKALFLSLGLSLISTLVCLLLAYPLAMILRKRNIGKGSFVVFIFILPMWMNFLLRTYAWLPILGKNGFVNNFLANFGIGPIQFLYNDGAVLLGMIYNFLPFMVLPIFTILSKMDQSLIDAASDLGATRKQIFTKVVFPLSLPGVISGITMVFMPAVSTFVISSLLGGGQYMLLGNLIEQQFTTMGNRNFGSAISIIMMIVILISMAVMNKFDSEDKEGSAGLW